MNQFIGNVLSLSCGEALGTFQGEVSAIGKDKQTISLKNAYRNGVKYEVPEVTIRAIDIKDLKILKTCEQVLQEKVQSIAARKPPKVTIGADGKIANKDGFTKTKTPQKNNKNTPQKSDISRNNTPKKQSEHQNGRTPKGKTQPKDSDEIAKTKKGSGSCKKLAYQNGDMENGHAMNKENREDGDGINGRKRHPSTGSEVQSSKGLLILPYEHSISKPINIEGGKGRGRGVKITTRNRECFSAPTDGLGDLGDFDFDSNLKLFNKAAVFEEIGALSGGENEVHVKKFYGHDEMILTDAENCAITDGAQFVYKTVSGIPVPSISTVQQQKLFLATEKAGLTAERRVEAVGINAARMTLQLLGGNKRFSGELPQDNPSVVVLAGPHIQGAQGVCCARHLANRDIDVTVFSTSYVKMADSISSELALFKETDGKHITSIKDLPTGPVDLVILALDCPNDVIIRDQPWCKSAKEWATTKQTILYAIDPPANSTLKAQFTLAIGMPLSYTCNTGSVYLCDIGIPRKVFLSVDLDYVAPFGHRHVIPLRNS